LAKGLDKQVYIYSVDTSAFYNDEENKIHIKLLKLYLIKKSLTNKIKNLKEQEERKIKLTKAKKQSTERINKLKSDLISLLNKHNSVRELRSDALKENSIIGMFDSALTRTIGMKPNQVSNDLLVVRVYYYQILKELIEYGFTHNGEEYVFFSSQVQVR
jgi:hypothetical protein